MKDIVYVYLLNEGTLTWRPVLSEKIDENTYLLGDENYDPQDEEWEFPPHSLVHVRLRRFSDEIVALTAFEYADQQKEDLRWENLLKEE